MDIETSGTVTCPRGFKISCYSYWFLSGEAPEDAVSVIRVLNSILSVYSSSLGSDVVGKHLLLVSECDNQGF